MITVKKDVMMSESRAISDLDKAIKQFGGNLEITCGGKSYKSVSSCTKISGTPKADFALVQKGNNPVCFISHKKAGGARAFQQYSGVSRTAGVNIYQHPEVQDFLKRVALHMPDHETLNQPLYKIIKDDKLICWSVFGPDYGKAYGYDNVNFIAQGSPKFERGTKGDVILKWSDVVHFNTGNIHDDASHFKVGDYKAILAVTYRKDRQFIYEGTAYKNVRAGIYPIGFVSGRSAIELD